jgi:hypothetical protein
MGAAIGPTILLPDADYVVRVRRIDGDPWLDLRIGVVRARLTILTDTAKGAAGKGTGAGHLHRS